jgi:hypothetical protein
MKGQRCSDMGCRTYVVAALGSIATLLYYVSIYMEAVAEEIRQLEKVNLIISLYMDKPSRL